MTDEISRLLAYVNRTNPQMTREKLIEELGKSHYSTISLIMTWQNSGDRKSMSA